MNYTKRGWDNIKESLDKIDDLYDKNLTRKLLLKNDYYKSLYGRSKNRTLIKDNPKLFKSIYSNTENLENKMLEYNRNPQMWNFTKRIKFIVDLNYDIEKLKCECGSTYTWNSYCRRCPSPKKTWLGKKHTKKTKKKQRISTLKYLEKQNGQIQPRYNIKSIQIIEEYGNKNGYNFQHAENGGEVYLKELGYFLDAYDVEKNAVLEIDETHHYKNGKLKLKDKIRQEEIENLLKCKFIRIRL